MKLSALHPRFCRAQRERVLAELSPRLVTLAQLAKRYDIGFTIDAEEADRLELSLDLLARSPRTRRSRTGTGWASSSSATRSARGRRSTGSSRSRGSTGGA